VGGKGEKGYVPSPEEAGRVPLMSEKILIHDKRVCRKREGISIYMKKDRIHLRKKETIGTVLRGMVGASEREGGRLMHPEKDPDLVILCEGRLSSPQ